MYLKFLYKHTIHVNFPFKPNILFITGYTSIIFIEIVKSTIRANLPDYLCNSILVFAYYSESLFALSTVYSLLYLFRQVLKS